MTCDNCIAGGKCLDCVYKEMLAKEDELYPPAGIGTFVDASGEPLDCGGCA